tara:strand:- start:3341 stop:3928 length:588 start_codon:yes stop_codon:yes gene_type:complete
MFKIIFIILTNTLIQNSMNEIITIGGGCFWCTEAIYLKVDGVISVKSGYSGGFIKNPSYREVCSGRTGHAEVCQIEFNPEEISLAQILDIFWNIHDPTSLNKQGNDVGTHYRSIILYHNKSQKKIIENSLKKVIDTNLYEKNIVTEIKEYEAFYEAEIYHENYFELNKNQPYCKYIIEPKVEKFKSQFNNYLSED